MLSESALLARTVFYVEEIRGVAARHGAASFIDYQCALYRDALEGVLDGRVTSKEFKVDSFGDTAEVRHG